jgi:hypothetical protein
MILLATESNRSREKKNFWKRVANTKGNVIIINDKQFDIAGIEDVVNLKKELIESAQAYLK